ncbi:AAA domain-containing protein [Rhizoctonia solani]|nr:AAA domain-containing protein [Rhizoctonia solani]
MSKATQCSSNNHHIPPHLTGLYVVGPSSSGKTTLCKALASRLHLPPTQHISEVARTVMRTSNFTRDHVDTLDMQRTIMNAQIATENSARSQVSASEERQDHPFLLCDRSAIDPLVYAALSATEATGGEILAESDGLWHILLIYRRAVFILLNPVKEWIEDDGVRSLADPSGYPSTYRQYLNQFGIKYYEIDSSLKDLDGRVNVVLSWAGITHTETL